MLVAYTQGSICYIAYPRVRFLPLFDFRHIVVRFFSCLAPSLEVDPEHERERLCFLLQLSPIWRQELYRHLYILPKPPPETFQSQTVPLFAKFSCLIFHWKHCWQFRFLSKFSLRAWPSSLLLCISTEHKVCVLDLVQSSSNIISNLTILYF